MSRNKFGVMRGLDPRIHDEARHHLSYVGLPSPHGLMDCRVKPGNDRLSTPYAASFFFGGAKRR
jgi:hypothetical protein